MQRYHEQLHAPVSWWVGSAVFAIACGWVILVATTFTAGLVTTVVVGGAVLAGVMAYGRAPVTVDSSTLVAGSAHLPLRFIGEVTVLDAAEWKHQMGPGADARAFIVSRPYLSCGVMIEITDPLDPAPYWLVSSRQPGSLALALSESIRDHGAQTDERKGPGEEENER